MRFFLRTHILFRWLALWTALAFLFTSSGVALAAPAPDLRVSKAASIQTLPGVWKSVPSGTSNSLLSVSFSSPTSGWAGGSKVLLRYDGSSWQVFSAPALGSDFVVFSISMVSDSDGWLVGYAKLSNPYYEGVILHWNGSLWNPVVSPTSFALFSISAVDANNAYTAGGATFCNPNCDDLIGYMYHWNGSSWSSPAVGDHRRPYDLDMLGNNDGWLVGSEKNIATNTYQALLMRWVGGSWHRVATPTMNSSWLEAVSVLDANHAWAVGGYATIMWNGSAWSLIDFNGPPQVLNDVQAVSASDVWIVGGMGTILHWDGAAMAVVSSPVTANLNGVAKTSSSELWAVGDNGTILHYYKQSSLAANNPSGAPGSFFNVSAVDFPPNRTAMISVNGHVLQTAKTDALGSLTVTLTTAGIEDGAYIVQVNAGSLDSAVMIHISSSAPVWPQAGSYPTLAVPAGIGFANSLYLPSVLH